MTNQPATPSPLPKLADLGTDLLRITPLQRITTLALPFACALIYFLFAYLRIWPLAIATLMYLTFITYGSISHDLVHRTLGLPRPVNEFFLTLIELLAFRSGHAYRLAHLNHHARFPHEDDIEGAAAHMTFLRAVAEGVIFQPRIFFWALRTAHSHRKTIILEIAATILLFATCLALAPLTPIFAVYAIIMVMGTWVFPVATSYIPHNPEGASRLSQTRLFRGTIASLIAMEHLYHLEHHLYPAVPHHNWPKLARRLDPFLAASGVQPVILGF